MDRFLIFRGKHKKIGFNKSEWVYGYYVYKINDFGEAVRRIVNDDGEINIDGKTLGQFTGLYDKIGTQIFEGDIVKTKYGRLCVFKYKALEGFVGYDLNALEDKHKSPDKYDLFKSKNLEVVGNIYDNKELLKFYNDEE